MNIQKLLNQKVNQYNHVDFIVDDPISIPHAFSKKQDIEIAAFFAAILAWGNRKSIINSSKKLMQLMDNAPYDFVYHLPTNDALKKIFNGFVHRTFNSTDLIHILRVFHYHYKINKQISLEKAFSKHIKSSDDNVENALNGFYRFCFNQELFPDFPIRTTKHIAAPFKESACKKLNMFLRWMVRRDNAGVDFGIWKSIKPHQLVMPLDVHVLNVALHYRFINSNKTNWNTAVELTNILKKFDKKDPVKYDYALFGIGVNHDI